MSAFHFLLSQGRRHCIRASTKSSICNSIHRSLCSSSSSESKQETQSNDPSKSRREPVPIQPVSYPTKPTTQSPPEETLPEKPHATSFPRPPRDRASASLNQVDTDSERTSTANTRTWTREEIRYVKDVPSISPVSYPSRVAPLPEDRFSVQADEVAKTEDKVSGELERERRRIEAENRMRRRLFTVEEETVPFPTLIKVEKKNKQKVVLDLQEAIKQVKASAKRTFDETVEAHVNLGIDPKRSDQKVRGSTTLPHGSGKVLRVAVFAEGAAADEARAAGADFVGGDELIEEVKKSGGKFNFDKCISTPLFMPHLQKIASILRSMMPNPKLGSVTNDITGAVKEAKQGRIDFRVDSTSIVHVGLGKVSFSEEALRDNIGAFVNALLLAKPVGLKKTSKYAGYVNSFHLCSTMGPGFPVSIQSLSLAADRYNKLQQLK